MKLHWLRHWGSSGALAFAALAVAVVSGVALALPFDIHNPYDSVALLLLTNPGGRFYRNVHYWSAQAFVILTIVHAWRHLARSSERRLSLGLWTRVSLSLPLCGFLMLSGFILKGDGEGWQALRIISTAIAQIPVAGRLLSLLLFGTDPASLQVLYVHHVATATVLVWLFVSEHAKAIWPRVPSLVLVSAAAMALGMVVAPKLHDSLDPALQGPWYFVGLQEVLHHATRPPLVTGLAGLVLVVVFALPRLSLVGARRTKVALAVLAVAYAATTVFALSFRGENWSLTTHAPGLRAGLSLESPLNVPSLEALRARAVPIVLGRREGCLFCHAETTGLSASHRPDAVGCASCHAGNPFSLDRTIAHRGLVLIPGNLDAARRTCGSAGCHDGIVSRVNVSIMTTMSGVIDVDRATFGERATPTTPSALGSSAADTHLRQLCASCHLGTVKREPGPITDASRGGGCLACHLQYGRDASAALANYKMVPQTRKSDVLRFVHPDVSTRITGDHCFGCHSRSSRISTSYEGWHEQASPMGPGAPPRTLADGRVFVRERSDVHFEKGMLCVDCHTSREVMGDGFAHARKHEQFSVACEDCHAEQVAMKRHEEVDAESKRILTLAGRFRPGQSVLVTRKHGEALTNTNVNAAGRPRLVTKRGGAELDLKPPLPVCVQDGGHARLSCITCHGAWSPRCANCHTAFQPTVPAYDHVKEADVTGAWTETGTDFRAEPPTLGIRTAVTPGSQPREAIDPFIPGMILTIDRNRRAGAPPDTVFRRQYARTFSHTVSARSRTCQSCHNDPVALGYGRGALRYERTARGGRWTFTPEQPRSSFDGLPADAWIGFLEGPAVGEPPLLRRSTRADVRPFNVAEQKRILSVGACLTCHPPESAVMRESVRDFKAVLGRTTTRCLLPRWDR
ncbi:MAG TPA: hypothetical protein VGK32_05400 [Vicinamibacterales bacterium]